MNPPRQRKGAGPAQAPQIQPRPAERAQARVRPSQPEPDTFPPNPVPATREGREAPADRDLRVIGPKEVGGVTAPGRVAVAPTDAQLAALIAGGHVEPWTEPAQDQGDDPDEEGN